MIADILTSHNPAILAGYGVMEYRDLFYQFIHALNIPVMLSWRAVDLLPDDHPLYAGRPGRLGQPEANKLICECDYLLVLGARIDDGLTAFNVEGFAPRAYKVIVDIDKAELDRLPEWEKIHKDCGKFMRELLND